MLWHAVGKSQVGGIRTYRLFLDGDAGMQLLRKHLGKAAMSELETFGPHQLPHLAFTAGVHPHDAKSCGPDTLEELHRRRSPAPAIRIRVPPASAARCRHSPTPLVLRYVVTVFVCPRWENE